MDRSERPTVSIDQIWNSFTVQLRRFIASRVQTEADVDDILQEVFIKIHRGIDKLEDRSKLHAWIFQITRNAIVDHYRKTEHYVEISDELPEVVGEETAGEEVAAEVASWLQPMMDELPEKDREAFNLTDIQGFTQKELAERLKISLSGAKSRVQRAKEPDCRYCTIPLTRK